MGVGYGRKDLQAAKKGGDQGTALPVDPGYLPIQGTPPVFPRTCINPDLMYMELLLILVHRTRLRTFWAER